MASNKDFTKLGQILTNMRIKFEDKKERGTRTLELNTKQLIGSMEMQVMFENVIKMNLKMFISENLIVIYE